MRQDSKSTGFILVADGSNDHLDNNLKEAIAPTDYALLHVKNGREAIALLEVLKSEIELVIIEAEFPLENGLDLIGRLLRRSQPKPAKIMMTTREDRLLSPQFVRGLGVDAVVYKPIGLEEWRKTVDAILNGEPVIS